MGREPFDQFDHERILEDIGTEHLSECLKRAEAGDKKEAIEALGSIAYLLHLAAEDQGKYPAPDYVMGYLSRSLLEMVRQHRYVGKINANAALHIAKRGPQIWTHYDKRLCANMVLQAHMQGLPIDGAAEGKTCAVDAAAHALKGTKYASVDRETLKAWYYEPGMKEELEKIYGSHVL